MRVLATALLALVPLLATAVADAQTPLRIIAIGAHPDDCDIRAGGVAAKWAALGHKVRFVAVTNGDAGHMSEGGGQLAMRRRKEAEESARRLGIEYVVLDNHDGELLPDLRVREQLIRQIRQWQADLVLAPRPNDYHPDHRYTGVLVQDAAFMVTVPNVTPDTPALRKNPVFMYFEDGFQKPAPFRPDVAIPIDDVIDRKVDALDAHVSQMYEWLPWHDGNARPGAQRSGRPQGVAEAIAEPRDSAFGPRRRRAMVRRRRGEDGDRCRSVRGVRVRGASRRGEVEGAVPVRAAVTMSVAAWSRRSPDTDTDQTRIRQVTEYADGTLGIFSSVLSV
jgi:LmbE family N-acetylglucosaminyl deacetylase